MLLKKPHGLQKQVVKIQGINFLKKLLVRLINFHKSLVFHGLKSNLMIFYGRNYRTGVVGTDFAFDIEVLEYLLYGAQTIIAVKNSKVCIIGRDFFYFSS